MHRFVLLNLAFFASGVLGQFESNLTFIPNDVPHGEVVIIECIFNIPLSSVGLISIELTTDDNLYEYQPDTGGVIDDDYVDKIISEAVDDGFLRLEMIVDLAMDTNTYFCVIIDEDFETYYAQDDLVIGLPLVHVTTEPAVFRHGDRVTLMCEFVPLSVELWKTIAVSMTSAPENLLYLENTYPTPGKYTYRYGNGVPTYGQFEMTAAEFTDHSLKGTLVANYPAHDGSSLTCELTNFSGNISSESIRFNVSTENYVTITPNPAVVGDEVEFRCDYGYYIDYIVRIIWTKDDVEIINIAAWGVQSTINIDGILTSTEGDGFYSFTKKVTEEDDGLYGCFVNTEVSSEVSYQYQQLNLTEPTLIHRGPIDEKVKLFPPAPEKKRNAQAPNIRAKAEQKVEDRA